MAERQVSIELLRVSAVVPASPSVKRRMFLSNLDLFWIPTNNVQRLLFYKTSFPENEFAKLVETLKRSLSLVLVDFYPLAGRLDIKEKEQSGRPEVECNDAGVEFIEASIDMAFQDMENEDFRYKSFFKKLTPTLDAHHSFNHESYDAPLLSIQVTYFRGGGGICVGTTLHHVIADGNSFWQFMKCWAERSRGFPISKNIPEHMRTVFKRDYTNIPNISWRTEEVVTDRIKGAQIFKYFLDDLLPIKSEYETHESDGAGCASLENTDENSFMSPIKDETDLRISTFHFSEQMIQKLKERTGPFSSFVAVAAHFWRCVVKARQIPEKEPVVFGLLADCRSRVNPPLPHTYFGNCLWVGFARTTVQQLLCQDICFAATLIHEVVSSCTDTQINYMIDFLNESPGDGIMRILSQVRSAARYGMNVVSSHKFPVYEIDYGWGKPVNVQVASVSEIGGMVLFPGRDTEGGGKSIDVSTCLPSHHMKTLEQLLMSFPD